MSTRRADAHPDFLTAAVSRRYTGSLRGLFVFLEAETHGKSNSVAWRVLPGGALVSMRRGADGKRVLRIARSKKPEGAAHTAAWRRECDTFVEHFVEPAAWTRVEDENAPGVATEFHEPREPGEDDE